MRLAASCIILVLAAAGPPAWSGSLEASAEGRESAADRGSAAGRAGARRRAGDPARPLVGEPARRPAHPVEEPKWGTYADPRFERGM